ncbi:MAG: hypothetical protein NTX86_00990 [Candidatus Dependentiae bacterium]|nr:hypothetical protein [Candidatus Dependentiae bacterium]
MTNNKINGLLLGLMLCIGANALAEERVFKAVGQSPDGSNWQYFSQCIEKSCSQELVVTGFVSGPQAGRVDGGFNTRHASGMTSINSLSSGLAKTAFVLLSEMYNDQQAEQRELRLGKIADKFFIFTSC